MKTNEKDQDRRSMFKLVAVKIMDDLHEINWDLLFSYVDQKKQDRLKRYAKFKDARRSLVGELLLRIEMMKGFQIKNHEIMFAINEYGKPFLKGFDPFYFNLSHSGDWIVCAMNDTPLGVDIEKISPIDFQIAQRFFAKEEYENLMRKNESMRLNYFFELWTAKESYIKAVGKGFYLPFHSFSINEDGNTLRVDHKEEEEDWFLRQYSIDPEYKMTVCAKTLSFPKGIIIKKEEEIYRDILSMVNY